MKHKLFYTFVGLGMIVPVIAVASIFLTQKETDPLVGSYIGPTEIPQTAFGDVRIAELNPILQNSFEYTVDNTTLTINTTTNSGTITQANAMAVIDTGTTTNSYAYLQSAHGARYRAGMGGLTRFTAMFSNGATGASQWVGIMDEQGTTSDFKNGFAIGISSSTPGIVRFQNDVTFFTPLSSCDDPLDGTGKTGMTFNSTTLNVFAIQFQYLGAGVINYMIENPEDGKLEIFCQIDYANTYTVPSVYNPNFHFTIYADNGGTTTDITVRSASYAFFVEGLITSSVLHQPQFTTDNIRKNTVTAEVPILTVRNKSQYVSKENFIEIQLEHLGVSFNAAAPNSRARWRLIKNGILTGASYVDVDTSDSVADMDTSASAITGGQTIFPGVLTGQDDDFFENLTDYNIILHPGETVTLMASSTNSATIVGSLIWKELF